MDLSSIRAGVPAAGVVLLLGFLLGGMEGAPVPAALQDATASVLPWLGAGFAAILMLVTTPLVIRGARRWGWVDQPKTDRWHSRPVALLGGLAIFTSGGIALLLSGAYTAFPWPVWAGAGLVFAAGLADDLLDIRPEAKLIVQVVATVLVLYGGYAFWRGGPFWVSIPLTFFWVIGITNAVNLIDGMDGLAAGIAAIAATILGIVAWVVGDVTLATTAAIVASVGCTFLVFNFHPARIFMGDCGSMMLGFLLAAIAMNVQGRGGPATATLAPMVVLAVPIFDTAFVTVTRILSGRPVTEGGTDHTMHRLVMLGLSERQAVLFLYAVSLAFGLGALGVYWATAPLFFAFALLAVVSSVVFGLYLAQAQSYADESMRVRVGSTTMLQRIGAVMRAIGGGAGWKSVAGAMADLLVVGAAFVAAYHLRFDSVPPAAHWNVMMQALPAVIALKVGVFYVFRLYHGIWRHAGTPEMVRLVGASTVASGLTCVGLVAVFGPERLSTSVLILDWLLSTIAVGSVRFGFRGLRQYFASHRSVGRRVLIVGTGPESVLVLRYLRQSDDLHRTAVGFIDEDRQKGLRLQGLLVLGGPDDLPSLLQAHDVDEVILPDGDDFSDDLRQVVRRACHQAGVPCQHFSLELRPSPAPHFDFSSGDGASSDRASSERPSNGTPSNNPPNASPGSSPDSSASSSPSRSSDSDSPEEIGR